MHAHLAAQLRRRRAALGGSDSDSDSGSSFSSTSTTGGGEGRGLVAQGGLRVKGRHHARFARTQQGAPAPPTALPRREDVVGVDGAEDSHAPWHGLQERLLARLHRAWGTVDVERRFDSAFRSAQSQPGACLGPCLAR